LLALLLLRSLAAAVDFAVSFGGLPLGFGRLICREDWPIALVAAITLTLGIKRYRQTVD